jgi:putative ABC transport system permease protein
VDESHSGGVAPTTEVCGWEKPLGDEYFRRKGIEMLKGTARRNALVVLTLALGISAVTAIFSFVRPMLLHPLLYPNANRLVVIQDRDQKGGRGSSWPEIRDIAKAPVFSGVAAWEFGFFFLTGGGESEQVAGSLVTPNLFRVLRVAPALGRDFRDGEDGVVILSDACWKHRFGADPNILGRSMPLNFAGTPANKPYTVIGVMPPDFWMYYRAFEVFIPLSRASMSEDRKVRDLAAFARLRDGVTLEQTRNFVRIMPHDKDWITEVRLWEKSQTEDIRSSAMVLSGGGLLLLLIATANAAGLLLVRAQGRRREIAIRAALGASPWSLKRLLIGESLNLGVFAGGIGVLLAWWGLRAMIASLPAGGLFDFLPSLDRVVIDWLVLLFAVAASMFACVIAGIFPASVAGQLDLVTTLKDGAAIASPGVQRALITAEIALSVTLLTGAGLLVKTMANINAIDPGFRSDHLLALRAPVLLTTDQTHATEYYNELQTRLAALPGVQSVALASSQPLGFHLRKTFVIPGRSDPAEADYQVVTPNYFVTLGIPIRQGRAFDARDDHRALVNQSLARKYWNGDNPIGKVIRIQDKSVEIIGICGDTRDALLREPEPMLFRSWRDDPDAAQQVDVRTLGDPLALAGAVKRVVHDVGGAVAEVHRSSEFIDDVTWQQKQSSRVLSAFAMLALALAVIGLYSIISLAISRRTREIGIRVAIGARPSDVVWLVLRESARPVLTGLALGLATALSMSRLLTSILYGVAPSDPMVLAWVFAVVTIAAICACLVPLWRALRVDPMISLRYE